jgi:flagellar biosynthesis/type III secretory pathway protein FliH
LDIHNLADIIANQGFSIALSILLIFRIDRFMQEIVTAQKEGYRQVLENTKEIHNTITTLNQQNREYYSLRFSEVQKELAGMKVELGKYVVLVMVLQ